MKKRGACLSLLAVMLAAAPGCVDIERTQYEYCAREPERCFTPYFLDFTARPMTERDTVTFYVAARDPSPDRQLTFKWSSERNIGLFWGDLPKDSTSQIHWNNPPCMPRASDGSHGVLVTVTAANPQGRSASRSFKFEVPLACPEWTRFTLPFESASHTATRLKSGRVLVAGGVNARGSLKSTELYGPIASSASQEPPWGWARGNLMNTSRAHHAATLMNSGKVLITGGYEVRPTEEVFHSLSSAEVYDPNATESQEWTSANPMALARARHTATLLPTGNVLVAGGLSDGTSPSSSSEEYSHEHGTWSSLSRMSFARAGHTATLLPTGHVLVVGGFEPSASSARGILAQEEETASNLPFGTVELYDPETKQWQLLEARLKEARYAHTATLLPSGEVLITGGFNEQGPLTSSELFNPNTKQWTPAGGLLTARGQHTAALLPNGQVLVAAGQGADGPLNSTEFFTPDNLNWSPGTSLSDAREAHSATVLFSGAVLVTGGSGPRGYGVGAELYTPPQVAPRGRSTWLPVGDMLTAQAGHTATKLDSGKVLVSGGYGFAPGYPGAIVYSPVTNTWLPTSPMVSNRDDHTATLLPSSGQVLVAGGDGLGISELYDPATDTWAATNNMMGSARKLHTATLLPNGKVLVAGGELALTGLATAELYEPVTGLWTPTGDMITARERHTATLLPDGKVLVTGGTDADGGAALNKAELYDPASGTWTATADMPFAALLHRATLLPNGKVLILGGTPGTIWDPPSKNVALYDPVSATWTVAGDMNQARNLPTVTLLLSGRVFVAGGDMASTETSTAELYEPDTGLWSPTVPMSARRFNHTATLLSSGGVLVTGGVDFDPLVLSFLPSAEVYVP
jgi:hypothetical protein